MILLNIPFYENKKGNQCMQVAMKCVIKYFLNKDISLEKLDRLTGRKNNFWTWTSQIVPVLYDFGLDVKYYSKTDIKLFLNGKEFIKKHFGEDAEKILKFTDVILKFTDVNILLDSIRKLMKYSIFEKRKLEFKEIEDHISKGHVPLMLIDYNKIAGREELYQGHFVVVTGFDENNVYHHESGPENPEPNKKVSKQIFIEAWNANGTDNDVVIVYGKRKN